MPTTWPAPARSSGSSPHRSGKDLPFPTEFNYRILMFSSCSTQPLHSARQIHDPSDPFLHLTPDLPGQIPGNAQYTLIAPLPVREEAVETVIEWPADKAGPPGFDYPGNVNFASVLHEIIFISEDGLHWQRMEGLPPAKDRLLRFTLPPRKTPGWISVGIPYFSSQERNLRESLADRSWQIEEIGLSRGGRPIHGYFRGAATARARGTFLLSAYQHFSEWAGPIALDALLRTSWDDLPGAEEFAWAIIPVVNIDALELGWQGDLQHNFEPHEYPQGPNLNRAWHPPDRPESIAAANFFRRAHEQSPALHLCDFHMGWSSPHNSGGGLTCFHPGQLSPRQEEREKSFTKRFFQEVPIEPFPWIHSQLDRPNAAAWGTRELGCLGQTLEISRFRGYDPAGNPIPVSQEYYQSIGPAVAQALIAFHRENSPD